MQLPIDQKKADFPEVEIPRLIDELQNLNDQEYDSLQDTLTNVYDTLENNKNTYLKVQKIPDLSETDLIALCQGVQRIFSYYPRPVQLISVYLLFTHSEQQGRLAQIYTGEGKTIIVAMLAVLLAIKKQSFVDIVTSSSVLAKRDAKDLISFYRHFNLKVSHNISDQDHQKKVGNQMLDCYKANIVYGDAHSFEGDLLNHEYAENRTRGKRQQEYVIVDEVDSMLIDGSRNQTFLSSPIPGMLDITKILRLIWDEVCKNENNIKIDSKNIKDIKDIRATIINDNEIYQVELHEYISKTLDYQINEAVGKLMLSYRLDYIRFMKDVWITNAIQAKFILHKDKDYVIDKGQVRIVDFLNTGVIHTENMQWQHGMHQFVQFKHNLNETPLTISTNFMSNVCFFKRYQHKLLGLTGTLGSEYTKKLLAKQYNVDFVLIPPNKPRILAELSGKALTSQNQWLQEIQNDVQEQLSLNRSVLLINETIQDVRNIEQSLRQNGFRKIMLYTDDSQNINNKIEQKQIIIATNLAGRGTDLITNNEIEKNGGLHVIVTFFPQNIRVQEQAFGRTARQGRAGTARLIIWKQLTEQQALFFNLIYRGKNQELELLNHLKQIREQNEEIIMQHNDQEMDKLMYEDECFQTFCRLAKSKINMKQDHFLFKSLEEKWGFYLEQHKQTGLNINDIAQIINENTNPKYLIMQGIQKNNDELIQSAYENSKDDPAVVYYQGCFLLKQFTTSKKKNDCFKILNDAKQLFLNKIADERGYYLAVEINRKLINQFQVTNEKEKEQHEQGEEIFGPLFETSITEKVDKQLYSEKIDNNRIRPQTAQYVQQYQNDEQVNLKMPQKPECKISLENLELKQNDQFSNISDLKQFDLSFSKEFQQKYQRNSKIENQIKVYQKFVNNIDDMLKIVDSFNPEKEVLTFSWVPTLPVIRNSLLKKKQKSQEQTDKEEVVQDGPFPKMGKIQKRKKPTESSGFFALFAIGFVEVVVGCIICACTAGAAIGIGTYLIKEGIKDMALAITSAIKGTPINWGQWGQQKVSTFCATLALAGPAAIKQAFTVAGKSFKTLEKVGLLGILNQNINKIGLENLRKAGKWLTKMEQTNLQNQYDTIKFIAESTEKLKNKQEILEIAQDILREQVRNSVITSTTSNEIEHLVKMAISQCYGTNALKNIFWRLCSKFLTIQMGKFKSTQDDQLNQGFKEVFNRNGDKEFEMIQTQMLFYNQNEAKIKTQLSNLKNQMLHSFNCDLEIQKQLFGLDVFFEKMCDQEKIKQHFSISNIQQYFEYEYQALEQTLSDSEFITFDTNNQQQVKQFYTKHIRSIIQKFISASLNQNEQAREPFGVLLYLELRKQSEQTSKNLEQQAKNLLQTQNDVESRINQMKTNQFYSSEAEIKNINFAIENLNASKITLREQIEQFKNAEGYLNIRTCISLIVNLRNKGFINQDGFTCSPQFISQFQREVANLNYPAVIQPIFNAAIQSVEQQAKTIKYYGLKLFSRPLIEALESELIQKIEQSVYEEKMEALEEEIKQNQNFFKK